MDICERNKYKIIATIIGLFAALMIVSFGFWKAFFIFFFTLLGYLIGSYLDNLRKQ